MSTAYHAKYFSHELTKRCASDSIEKFAGALADAQVDLNPHQVEAALFAFRSPLSKGAVLADEVGLGKTIEAGILLTQKWAERKRRLLVICPANLRKQWSEELADKFFLPSAILEKHTFNEEVRRGNLNPLQQDAIIICSYHFTRSQEPYIRGINWDLVVIDEAHRLRNVYKNNSKIAQAIKQAVAPFHKVLLTATPLQNSLLELFGLVSIIDEFTFGDLKSFRTQFSGVFGASDEVLGAVESGVDFEKRIAAIYQKCRTQQQIEFEFDALQHELESDIDDKRREARDQLLNNFDQEVVEKVRISSVDYLGRFEDWLWQVTRFYLAPYARFDADDHSFMLERNPFEGERIHPGPYRLGKQVENANTYRIGHPLAQRILTHCKALQSTSCELTFHYSDGNRKITVLEPLRGKSGWLTCVRLSLSAFETEDYILFAAMTEDGVALEADQGRRLFDLPAEVSASIDVPATVLQNLRSSLDAEQQQITNRLTEKNGVYFDAEMDKLDRWAEDRRASLKAMLDDLDLKIRDAKREARLAPNLPAKLELQRQLQQLESKRNAAWKEFDEAAHDIERQKDKLLDDIGKRLNQQMEREELFAIRWRVV